jgi:hypothetical protein
MPRHRIRPIAAKFDHMRKEQPVSRTKALERQEADAQAQITAPIVSTP